MNRNDQSCNRPSNLPSKILNERSAMMAALVLLDFGEQTYVFEATGMTVTYMVMARIKYKTPTNRNKRRRIINLFKIGKSTQ